MSTQEILSELTPFYKRLAKKEVGENPDHVTAHLTSFKRWLASSAHLIVPTNDIFLLSFLRFAHYDHAIAQRRLDNYCTLRCTDKVISKWYIYPSLSDPLLDTYLDTGIFLPIGFMESGLHVIIIRLAAWKPQLIDQLAMRTMNNMSFERFIFDQRCQIGGYVFIIDMSGTDGEQVKNWVDLKNAKSAFKLMQESSPARVKHLIFFNENRLFDVAFKLAEVWLSDKLKQRVLRTKDDMNKAFKKIPGLKDVLPVEYGGKNDSVSDCIERNKKEFLEFFSKGTHLKDIRVDESKRPDTAKNYMREYKESDVLSMGTTGTFISVDPGD